MTVNLEGDQLATFNADTTKRFEVNLETDWEREKKLLVVIFRENLDQGKEMVRRWVEKERGGDPELLDKLEKSATELVGTPDSPKYDTNNLFRMLPKETLSACRADKRKIRKAHWDWMVAGSGRTYDSPMGEKDDPYTSERWKQATVGSITLDIEEGLRVLKLNRDLARLNQMNEKLKNRMSRFLYNRVTVPLLLFLRVAYGYEQNELIT